MVCMFFFVTYTSFVCNYRMVLLDLFSSSNEGSMEWVSLLSQRRASKAFRPCFNIRAIAGSYCECDRFAIAPVSFCFVVVASVT